MISNENRAFFLAALAVVMIFAGGSGILAVTAKNADPDADGCFAIAVIPDTQQEVVVASLINQKAFRNRTQWLVDHRQSWDLRYVIHTGDVVNWDTYNHDQYEIASDAFSVLDEAGIMYSLAIGNHDTAAVGPGGSAIDPPNTKTLVRNTTTFNHYFPVSRFPGIVCFETGKVDNSYRTFRAAGKDWLVLTLELWPRTEVITWARGVAAGHASHNILVSTHSYLDAGGGIYAKSDYGANSPKYLYENFILLYPNIKMVFCGHTGHGTGRVDVGVNGNIIISLLGAFHSNTNNPVQLVSIDTKKNTISTRFFAPLDSQSWPQYTKTFYNLSFVGDTEKGDINGDGAVTAADALLALQHSVQKITLTNDQILLADIDGNSFITAADALSILQYAVNKISVL